MVMQFGDGQVYAMAKWMLVAAVFTLGACIACIPPYGRYSRSKVFGIRFPLVNAKLAWCLMESPNLWTAAWCLLHAEGDCLRSPANVILVVMFVGHYANRSLIFPFRMRGSKPMPVLVMVMATIFCSINGYTQCSYLLRERLLPTTWTSDPRFLVGSALFASGFYLNYQADAILRELRGPGETDYKIPRGGLFEYVSGANYLAECLEWGGFAMAGWSLPGFAFFSYALANLVPRAYRHHEWYLEKFRDDYPQERKAFVPLLW